MPDKTKFPIIKNLLKYATNYSFELELLEIILALSIFTVSFNLNYHNKIPNLKNNSEIITPFIKENISFLFNLWQGLK